MNWFEDNKRWQIFYDCMFDQKSFSLALEQSKQIVDLVCHPVHSVLDLACGPGRHMIGFAQMGLSVTGVDLSSYLLNRAANHLAEQELSATLVHSDLLAYEPTQKFDLITNLFTSFGYYDQPKENQQVLDQAYKWLNDSGTLIIDTFGKEQIAHIMEPVHCTEYPNGDLRFERPMLIDNMNVFANEWILVQGDQAHRWEYQHHVYTASELSSMLKQAGFQQVDIYGSLAGAEYDLEAERLVAVAKK